MSGPERIVLHAVGDVGFGSRLRQGAMPGTGADPFSAAAALLSGADILFGNLETPLVADGLDPERPEIPKGFAGAPEHARRLSEHGFTIVSLANNHVMDYGAQGLRQTLAALEREGIRPVGAGMSLEDARRPVILQVRGRRVAFLAYAAEGRHSAAPGRPGAAPLREEMVREDLAGAREASDAVVISLHFGLIYSDYPRPEDQRMARGLCAEGATLLLGHHPHVLQGIEKAGGSLVAYSLGEFLFDPAGGHVVNRSAEQIRRESGVLQVVLDGAEVESYRLAPTLRDDRTLFPVEARGETAERITGRMERISEPLSGGGLEGAGILGATARRTAEHQWHVFLHHLRHGHFGILARWIVRVRPRHVILGLRAIVARFRP